MLDILLVSHVGLFGKLDLPLYVWREIISFLLPRRESIRCN